MKTYEQNKKYADKYLSKMDEIKIRMSKESSLKDAIQNHAQATGESVQGFILRAIREAMERENADPHIQDWHNEKEEG